MPTPAPEDLILEVAAADKIRRQILGKPPGHFRPGQRVWIEPPFNFLGRAWGMLMFLVPWSLRKAYVQFVIRKMGGHGPDANPDLKRRIESTVTLARQLQQKTGAWPALLVATSHPETEGSWQWLRFEVMAQGVALADAYVEARAPGRLFYSHPRCLLAIDPFALDTIPPVVAGIYSGWMHQIYLAYDRQSHTQSWIQRNILLRGTNYQHIAWRFLRFLRSDTPILMAFGGGLPYNARLLYAVREFVHRLTIPRGRVNKRMAQLELIRILLQPEGTTWFAATGVLTATKKAEIRDAMGRWGIVGEQLDDHLQTFAEEFSRTVPRRERLLRILYGRLVKRGKPLIILPVSHSMNAPHVVVGEPISLESDGKDFRPFYQAIANIFDPPSSKV